MSFSDWHFILSRCRLTVQKGVSAILNKLRLENDQHCQRHLSRFSHCPLQSVLIDVNEERTVWTN